MSAYTCRPTWVHSEPLDADTDYDAGATGPGSHHNPDFIATESSSPAIRGTMNCTESRSIQAKTATPGPNYFASPHGDMEAAPADNDAPHADQATPMEEDHAMLEAQLHKDPSCVPLIMHDSDSEASQQQHALTIGNEQNATAGMQDESAPDILQGRNTAAAGQAECSNFPGSGLPNNCVQVMTTLQAISGKTSQPGALPDPPSHSHSGSQPDLTSWGQVPAAHEQLATATESTGLPVDVSAMTENQHHASKASQAGQLQCKPAGRAGHQQATCKSSADNDLAPAANADVGGPAHSDQKQRQAVGDGNCSKQMAGQPQPQRVVPVFQRRRRAQWDRLPQWLAAGTSTASLCVVLVKIIQLACMSLIACASSGRLRCQHAHCNIASSIKERTATKAPKLSGKVHMAPTWWSYMSTSDIVPQTHLDTCTANVLPQWLAAGVQLVKRFYNSSSARDWGQHEHH